MIKSSFLFLLVLISVNSFAQVGIGTNTPNASAKLEVKSTTQGFLPPRMTAANRNAIVSPAQGLVVYCTDCSISGELQVFNGNIWTNCVGGTAANVPAIGDSYQGGIIAYLLVNGDPGYNPFVRHGLIAATADQSTNILWNNGSYTTTNASGTAIGTGSANTNTIIAVQGGGTYAAYICKHLSQSMAGVTYSDWYLPSKDELNKLYLNKSAIGGFANALYWTSTEAVFPDTDIFAWFQDFATGTQSYDYKDGANGTNQYHVRAIRSF